MKFTYYRPVDDCEHLGPTLSAHIDPVWTKYDVDPERALNRLEAWLLKNAGMIQFGIPESCPKVDAHRFRHQARDFRTQIDKEFLSVTVTARIYRQSRKDNKKFPETIIIGGIEYIRRGDATIDPAWDPAWDPCLDSDGKPEELSVTFYINPVDMETWDD